MPKLSDSKLTMADMRIIAIISLNPILAAALARGDYELSKKLLKVEDGEVVDFTDDELERMKQRNSTYEPVDGDHRRLRRTCTE